MPAPKNPSARKTTKKATDAANEKRRLKTKGKKVNGGVNPATKQPHTENFLRSL